MCNERHVTITDNNIVENKQPMQAVSGSIINWGPYYIIMLVIALMWLQNCQWHSWTNYWKYSTKNGTNLICGEFSCNINCIFFNAHSICNKLLKLYSLLNVSSHSLEFDLLFMCETWLIKTVPNGHLVYNVWDYDLDALR